MSFWERTKTTGKKGFDWAWQKAGIAGEYMNKGAGKLGMEGFWPVDMPRELDKAARILYTFTLRGDKPESEDAYAEKRTQKVLARIPPKIIEKAEGIAIFTVWRTGFGLSASSGSGIVIARDTPTSWGPPSGILIHTIGFGFLAGMDVYDAVLILRNRKAVDAFAKPKVSLGAEIAVTAGPVGHGAVVDSGIEASPVFSYIKSKGVYGGLQVDGTVIIERNDENNRFYGRPYKAEQLLTGAVPIPGAATGLLAVLEAAEGKEVNPEDFPEDVDVAPSEQVPDSEEQNQQQQNEQTKDVNDGTNNYESTPLAAAAVPVASDSTSNRTLADRHSTIVTPINTHVSRKKLDDEDELIRRHSLANDLSGLHDPTLGELRRSGSRHSNSPDSPKNLSSSAPASSNLGPARDSSTADTEQQQALPKLGSTPRSLTNSSSSLPTKPPPLPARRPVPQSPQTSSPPAS